VISPSSERFPLERGSWEGGSVKGFKDDCLVSYVINYHVLGSAVQYVVSPTAELTAAECRTSYMRTLNFAGRIPPISGVPFVANNKPREASDSDFALLSCPKQCALLFSPVFFNPL